MTRAAFQAFLIFLIAIAVRILSIDQSVASLGNDEFYHLLAAEGWLREGSFHIADGYYPRAGVFTWMVAQSMALAPNSILMARLPAVIAGGMLVASVFLWTRRFGEIAAWTAAILLCFAEFAVESSQVVRFYSLHALAFWLGSISLYAAVYDHGTRRTAWIAAAAAVLTLALHLQVVTLIGVAALGAWLCFAWILESPSDQRIRRETVVVLAAGAILIVFWLARDFPPIVQKLAVYRWTATWAAANRNDWLYYYRNFADFGVLFYLLPVAVILAIVRAPRPAFFCLIIFIGTLALHSGAGMKGMQYVTYVLPYFFVLWGLAAAPLAAVLRAQFRPVATQWRYPKFAERALIVIVVGIAITGSHSFFRTARAMVHIVSGEAHGQLTESSAWIAAVPELRQLVSGTSVFLTRDDTRALYFLGGYDLMLNQTRLDDYAPGRDFAVDPRTGGAAIETASAMRRVIDCYESGLIVIPRYAWRNPSSVTNEVADLIESVASPIMLRSTNFFRIYRWRHEQQLDLTACAPVYRVAGDPGHRPFIARR